MALDRFLTWLGRVLRDESGPAPRSRFLRFPGRRRRPVGARRTRRATHASAALLSVDGGGQLLLCGAERLTLGHMRSGRADLGFLADVGSVHALLERADSLQEGPGWVLRPAPGELVTVDGAEVGHEGFRLAHGQRVRLGENLEFDVLLPDAASATTVLELRRGAECAGAQRILLLAPGPGGRVRVGAAKPCMARVPGLEQELRLEWNPGRLDVHSELELSGAFRGRDGHLPFPPPRRVSLIADAGAGRRPPFGLFLEPVERLEAPGESAEEVRP